MEIENGRYIDTERLISIEKITGVNFTIWRLKVEDILTLKYLQDTIRGKSKKSSSMNDGDWGKVEIATREGIFPCFSRKNNQIIMEKYELDTKINKLYLMKRLLKGI